MLNTLENLPQQNPDISSTSVESIRRDLAQAYLQHCIENGLQKGVLIALNNGAKMTKEMFAKVGDVSYQSTHPKTHAVLAQAYLDHCIENGLQIGAIKALTHGAKFTVKMYQLLASDGYFRNHPKTIAALRSYLRTVRKSLENSRPQNLADASSSSTYASSSTPDVRTSSTDASSSTHTVSSSSVDGNNNLNDLDIPVGDGLFRDLGLSHAKIQQLRHEQASNAVIQNAFKVIEEADKGFQSDIQYLTDFIHSKRTQKRVTEADVVNMIDEDISILSRHRALFGSGQNPKTWCVKRLLDDDILEKAKIMIGNHPELLNGRLPKPLKAYKSREVSVLKTALIYCALARDEQNFLMRNVKGAYRLELNSAQKSAVKNMHIVRGTDTQYLYAPLNSYVLRATQIEKLNSGDKVMMGDCSGYVSNVLKKLFGKEYPRLFTYDLACFHDYKMRRRQNLSVKNQGPIVLRSGEHSALTKQEIDNANDWHSNHHRDFSYLDSRLQTVSDMKNIRPGDLIIWRNKSTVDGRGRNGINGHIGVVLEADPAHNMVSLMENTAGSAYGIGIKKASIVSDSTTTRILRPKV